MIVLLEPSAEGPAHAPATAGLCRIVAQAFPGRPLRLCAAEGHLAAVRDVAGSGLPPGLELRAIAPVLDALSPFERLSRADRAVRSALAVPDENGPLLLVLTLGVGPVILAARRLRRQRRGRTGLLHMLHGEVAALRGWRGRNPIRRWTDLTAALTARPQTDELYTVLEEHIVGGLLEMVPGLAGRLAVFHHPLDPDEAARVPPPPAGPPVVFGVLGVQTAAKGFPAFHEVARRAQARLADRVRFLVTGWVNPKQRRDDYTPLTFSADPTRFLERSEFLAGLAQMHYVCLLYQPGGFYDLAASGVFYDAVNCGRPVLATPAKAVSAAFTRYGPLGHLVDGVDDAAETIVRLVEGADPALYEAQRTRLAAMRADHLPAALARAFHTLVTTRFPGLLAAA